MAKKTSKPKTSTVRGAYQSFSATHRKNATARTERANSTRASRAAASTARANAYATRKGAQTRVALEKQRTLRHIAYANAISRPFESNNIELDKWNAVINQASGGGTSQTGTVGDTTADNTNPGNTIR